MVAIKAVAHFSVPVSDVAHSTRFYTEVVGCNHLATVQGGRMAFLDAAGVCLILVQRDPPINPVPGDHGGVHHAFAIAHDEYTAALDHLRAHGIQITFEEDRQGGVLKRPSRLFPRSRRHGIGVYRSDGLRRQTIIDSRFHEIPDSSIIRSCCATDTDAPNSQKIAA